jgi:hypothetical protein
LGEGEFTPLIPLFPLPQTGKRNFKFLKQPTIVGKEKEYIS